MNAEDIKYPQGRYNPGGVSGPILYAFEEDIASFPELDNPETALTFESLIELKEAIKMKVGKQFHELYCTLETGELKDTVVGPRDGKGFENSMEISFPGNPSKFLGFKAAAANRNLVFIVPEKNKVIRVLGSKSDPAALDTGEGTSGKAIADARASVLTFKASGATPPPVYTLPLASLLVPGV